MEHTVTEGRDFEIDLESGRVVDSSVNEGNVYINLMRPNKAEDSLLSTLQRVGSCKPVGNAQKKDGSKEKCKKSSNKKPPRPPRSSSLDAADQKLMREIAELAMLKRARLERMKALKKAKNCKTSLSSSNTILALVFTIIFFLVVLYQVSPTTQSALVGLEGPSPESASGLISVQYYPSLSANFVDPPSDSSHELVQKVAGIDTRQQTAVTAAG